MPRPFGATDKLPNFSGTLDIKMARDLQPFDLLEVWVLLPVQLVGEQFLYMVAPVDAGWQTDGVQHDQVDACFCGARAKIW